MKPSLISPRRVAAGLALTAGTSGLSWESDIGDPYFNCDDCSYGVMLDFPFTYYGESVQWWYIASNGLMSTHNRPSVEETSFPHRRGDAIAPLAMDWWPDGDGPVHVNTLGSAPNRRFVVTWRNVPPYAFNGSASADPGGGTLTYHWAFGDGSTDSGANPTHVYADNGSYTVALTVTNASGLSNRQTAAIEIGNVAPAVSASLSAQSIVSGQTVQLAGSFIDPGVQDGPWGWTINWGTGTPATGSAASPGASINDSQRFCSARGYNVVLSVRDKDEATGSATATLTVGRKGVNIVAPASLPANGNGMVTVNVLGSADFDATTINLHSVLLSDGSGAGAPIALRGNGSYQATVEDVNGDGRMDLTLKFNRERIGLSAASTQLVLLGAMDDRCTEIRGASPVRVK
jgi:hypothetical protein